MKTKDKVAASLLVRDIPNMTEKGRKAICNWLRRQATNIQLAPSAYGKTFRARYLYSVRQGRRS